MSKNYYDDPKLLLLLNYDSKKWMNVLAFDGFDFYVYNYVICSKTKIKKY